jgi:hypothetical protein
MRGALRGFLAYPLLKQAARGIEGLLFDRPSLHHNLPALDAAEPPWTLPFQTGPPKAD